MNQHSYPPPSPSLFFVCFFFQILFRMEKFSGLAIPEINFPAELMLKINCHAKICYARACSSHACFILRATPLSTKLLEQGYVKKCLKLSLKKFLVDTGILSSNTKFLSHECLMTFFSLTKYNDNPPSIRLYTNP